MGIGDVSETGMRLVRLAVRWRYLAVVVVLALGVAAIGIIAFAGNRSASLHVMLRQPHIEKAPVVVVVFDELPLASLLDKNLELDRHAYPNFAAVADDSTWFRNTVAVTSFTKEAMPALLTGQYPEHVPARPGTTYPHNLFTMLGSAYDVVSHDNLETICAPILCNERVSFEDRDLLRVFGKTDRGRDAAAFLDEIEATSRPTLFFGHLVLPHEPWRYLPNGQNYKGRSPMAGETDPPGRGHAWGSNDWLVAQALQRHLLQLRFTDRVLGRVIDEMKREGIYDEALLVVAADHGAGFIPGFPKRLIREENAGYLGPVPFFVKLPHQQSGEVDDAPVQTVDVVPTIADVLDARTWPDVDGVSAFEGGLRSKRQLQKVTFDDSTDRLQAAVEHKFELLGRAADDPFMLSPPGTDIELGSAADELLGSPVDVDYDVDGYMNAHRTDDEFPAWLMGRVTGTDVATVVVTVNGRISGVTETYGRGEFQVLLAPRLFDRSPNQIEFFALPH